jgi:hypothetical protein
MPPALFDLIIFEHLAFVPTVFFMLPCTWDEGRTTTAMFYCLRWGSQEFFAWAGLKL